MSTVEKFSRLMIEKHLKSHDLKYLTDPDGDFFVHYAYDSEIDCEMTVYLGAEGKNNEIYCIRVSTDRRFGRDQWGPCLIACNTWNEKRRWPKAYLYRREDDEEAQIMLETQIDLEKGVHQELLDDITMSTVFAGYQFWKWLREEQML